MPDLLNVMIELEMTEILLSIIVRKLNKSAYSVLQCLMKEQDISEFMRAVKVELLR